MVGTEEQRSSAVASSAGEPGPLSRLLQELADTSVEDALEAWKKELQPGDRAGRFEIRREVGRGGFGAVYEAFDTELGRVVAVKTLRLSRPRRDLSTDWIKKEAEAVARLDHPCIVTLFDVGTFDSGPYLVMELLRGKTLAQRIAEGPIAKSEALRIAGEIAKGLAHAHQRGVLHRDLKPANVFLCDDGRVKLLDFGLAHLLGTRGAHGSGTPGYMPPEQVRGDEIDSRADVYAAAMTLRESMTGSRDPETGAAAPAALRRIIERALSDCVDDRPRDGTAWLEDLARAEKALARPRKLARAGAIGAAGLLLAGGLAYMGWHGGQRTGPAASSGRPSLAVLPFVDLSPGRDQEYLADGLAEEVLDALTHVEGLRVTGRTSSFSFKGKNVPVQEIGRKLNAGSILTGTVRKEGDRLRVTAQLVNAADGYNVWSESYSRRMEDILEVQDDVARAVVDALKVKLAIGKGPIGGAHTSNAESHDHYLQAQHQRGAGSLERARLARTALEKAIALDPRNARAHAELARVLIREYSASDATTRAEEDEIRRQAMAAAERAVEVGPDVAEAHAARGYLRLTVFDWVGGRADIERALELAPSHARVLWSAAVLQAVLGRTQEAIALAKRHVEIDPLSGGWSELGRFYLYDGRFAEAAFAIDRAIELSPGDQFTRGLRVQVHLMQRQPEAALAAAQDIEDPSDMMRLQGIALAEHDLGHRDESDRALEKLTSRWGHGAQYQIAQVHAWRGDADRAFEWLERAFRERDPAISFLRVDPALQGLRDDPRHAVLLRKMNFPVD